jgi:hypothetical protein
VRCFDDERTVEITRTGHHPPKSVGDARDGTWRSFRVSA